MVAHNLTFDILWDGLIGNEMLAVDLASGDRASWPQR